MNKFSILLFLTTFVIFVFSCSTSNNISNDVDSNIYLVDIDLKKPDNLILNDFDINGKINDYADSETEDRSVAVDIYFDDEVTDADNVPDVLVDAVGIDYIKLSWLQITDAKKYEVFRKADQGEFTQLKEYVEIHYAHDSWERACFHFKEKGKDKWTTIAPGLKMEKTKNGFSIKLGKTDIMFAFNSCDGEWDNNNESNYKIIESGIWKFIYIGNKKSDYSKTGDCFTENNFLDINLDSQQKYSYKIKAITKDGGEESLQTEVFAITKDIFIGPYLTWSGKNSDVSAAFNLNNSTTVNFETNAQYKATVQYKLHDDINWISIDEESETKIHHITLGTLEKNKVYDYQILDKFNKVAESYSFRSAKDGNFKFLVIADPQDDGTKKWDTISEQIFKHEINVHGEDNGIEHAAFIVMPGDLAADNKKEYWHIFFNKAEKLFASTVIMPAVGNHDDGISEGKKGAISEPFEMDEYLAYFKKLPYEVGKTDIEAPYAHYLFRYSNASFLAFNSEPARHYNENPNWFSDEKYKAQYDWAADTKLEKGVISTESEKSEWLFSYWHVPPYSLNADQETDQYGMRHLTKMFTSKVDWVFNGHAHIYQKFKPIIQKDENLLYSNNIQTVQKYGRNPGQGVGYMVAPSTGFGTGDYSKLLGRANMLGYENKFDYPKVDQDAPDSNFGYISVAIDNRSICIKSLSVSKIVNNKYEFITPVPINIQKKNDVKSPKGCTVEYIK